MAFLREDRQGDCFCCYVRECDQEQRNDLIRQLAPEFYSICVDPSNHWNLLNLIKLPAPNNQIVSLWVEAINPDIDTLIRLSRHPIAHSIILRCLETFHSQSAIQPLIESILDNLFEDDSQFCQSVLESAMYHDMDFPDEIEIDIPENSSAEKVNENSAGSEDEVIQSATAPSREVHEG